MNDIYNLNLKALKLNNLDLFNLMIKVEPNKNFDVFIGSDPADINFLDKNHNVFLFNTKSIDWCINKIKEFNKFSLYPYLYFFGLGNGVFYKLLFGNENIKRIVIIEPNIEIIFNVLNLVDFSQEIESKKLIIFNSESIRYENLFPIFYFNKNALLYSRIYNLHIFNDYYNIYEDEAIRVNKIFIDIIEHGVISIGNDSKDAITGIKHHILNMPLMLNTPSLVNLAQNAKNTNTAIIVSTGPSLFKQLNLLKQVQDSVTIFCIDASFPILSKHNIKPDIVLSLERVDLSAKFYEEVDSIHFKDVIFEITSIAHPRLINAIKNKNGFMQISQRPFGYTSYFELNEYGYIGIGMSAANMAYELIVHSGFNNCIFIGQDLAFNEDGMSHSKDSVFGENEIKNDKQKVLLEKYGGGGFVESTQVWKLFLNFFIKDINDTKHKIKVINATEGGARIPGTIEMSFKDALKNINLENKKQLIKLSLPSEANIKLNLKKATKKIQEYIKYGESKKKKIEDLFLVVVTQTEVLEKLNKENQLEKFDFNKLDFIFDEIEKIKKLFSNKKFLNMFNEASQSFLFHQEMEIAKVITKYTINEVELKAKRIELLFLHKYWLFYLAGCIDSVLFCIKDSFNSWKIN